MAVNPKDLDYPEIICPDCDGEGYFDRMTYLSYDGEQSWTQDACDTCDGNGWIYDPDYKEDVSNA